MVNFGFLFLTMPQTKQLSRKFQPRLTVSQLLREQTSHHSIFFLAHLTLFSHSNKLIILQNFQQLQRLQVLLQLTNCLLLLFKWSTTHPRCLPFLPRRSLKAILEALHDKRPCIRKYELDNLVEVFMATAI